MFIRKEKTICESLVGAAGRGAFQAATTVQQGVLSAVLHSCCIRHQVKLVTCITMKILQSGIPQECTGRQWQAVLSEWRKYFQ